MLNKEYITNLIPQEKVTQLKTTRYISMHRPRVTEEEQLPKRPAKTMGPAKLPPPCTKHFLKKGSKIPVLPEKKPFKYGDEETRRPPVPSKNDPAPLMGIRSNKNFVTENALENVTAIPKKPNKIYCDTRNGEKHLLEPSGLEPNYIKKQNYGDVPSYLKKREAEIREAQMKYDAYISEHMKQGAMKHLSDEERDNILDGLKKNWEAVHHDYQGMSVVTDTIMKKKVKERLEMMMKQLERDIELIEKHKTIYIAN